jgi:hypothetical protein
MPGQSDGIIGAANVVVKAIGAQRPNKRDNNVNTCSSRLLRPFSQNPNFGD